MQQNKEESNNPIEKSAKVLIPYTNKLKMDSRLCM